MSLDLRYAAVRERLDALIRILSPNKRCQNCDRKPRKYPLEIHHLDGRAWEPRDLNSAARATKYEAEHKAKVRLAAWCRSCNAADNSQARKKLNYARAARIMNKRKRSKR